MYKYSVGLDVSVVVDMSARYRAGTATLSFFSTLAQFGTPEDIAVAELKIEMMFPADDATRDALFAMQDPG